MKRSGVQALDEWQPGRVLGKVGSVFKGRNLSLFSRASIKVIPTAFFLSINLTDYDYADNQEFQSIKIYDVTKIGARSNTENGAKRKKILKLLSI